MSVNMPHLHTLFSNALDPKSLHTVLLMTVTGAVVISSSSVQSDQVQRTVITLAAVAVETWQTMKEPLNEPGSSSSHGAVSNEVQGGWATVEIGNVFVYPVVRPSKQQSGPPTISLLEQDTMFLLAVSGPEEAGWDLLEERAKLLSNYLAPIFADYNDSMAETPPVGSSRLPSTPRQARV